MRDLPRPVSGPEEIDPPQDKALDLFHLENRLSRLSLEIEAAKVQKLAHDSRVP
jgi:hypothetical protein